MSNHSAVQLPCRFPGGLTAAIVAGERRRYLRRPFQREPDFGVTSVNYDFAELLARAEVPR
jgi:hypothetical protein